MSPLPALLLGPPSRTLAVAESITSGQIQARIGAISGASKFFLGGITAYSLELKVRHLGIDRAEAEPVYCVSEEIAQQMASGVCRLFHADVGVSTTGFAEPWPARSVAEPYGWWAVALRASGGKYTLTSDRVDCTGASRTAAQELVADAALAGLIAALKAAAVPEEKPGTVKTSG